MRRMRLIALAVLLTAVAMPLASNAQSSSVMYGSSRNPMMNYMNPAFFPSKAKAYVSLPGLNMDFKSPLSYSNIFSYDSVSDKTVINANSILDTMAGNGDIRFGSNIHTFGLGVNFDKFFITLSTKAKMDMGFAMPEGLVTFLNEGNYNHTGNDYIELLDGQLISVRAYAEAALGFGYRITKNISAGIRMKLLMGYFDLSTAGSSARLYTAEDYSSITGVMNLNMNMSSFLKETTDANGEKKYEIGSLMPKNFGVNFDLGVRYSTDLFEVSASIVDLGPGIHWTDGVKRIVSARENNTFTFTGADVSNMMTGGHMDSTYTQMLLDSLKTLAEYKSIDGEAYWTSIPTKVNLGGMFHVNEYFSAGLHFHGEFDRGLTLVDDVLKTKLLGFYSNTTLMARAGFHDWIEVIVCASVLSNNGNWDWFNPGFGVTITPFRTLQLYAFMDYISNIYLIDAKQVNLSLGLNLLFGGKKDR